MLALAPQARIFSISSSPSGAGLPATETRLTTPHCLQHWNSLFVGDVNKDVTWKQRGSAASHAIGPAGKFFVRRQERFNSFDLELAGYLALMPRTGVGGQPASFFPFTFHDEVVAIDGSAIATPKVAEPCGLRRRVENRDPES